MKEAKISEFKNNLSRYLSLVRQGESVRILDRDRPVATIVPVQASGAAGDEPLAEMERKGLVRRGSAPFPEDLLGAALPGAGSGVLAALLEERDAR